MMKDWEKYKITGFTLAEVLITLGIIGIVAALTIPVLMNNIQDQQFKEAYKKAYSTASQAWMNAYTNGNLTLCNDWSDTISTCNADNFNAFKNEMKISKNCGTNTASCWNMSGEKGWQGTINAPAVGALAFIDTAGVEWTKITTGPGPEILIDTNGDKPPNQYGRDRAVLYLYYGSASTVYTPVKYQNKPIIGIYSDVLSNTTNQEAIYRCPSYATHPCYYTSWITGGN